MKRVLFISYHFPPDASVGGLRIAKFTKYLRPLGWESFVVTTKDQYRQTLDFTLQKELTQVKVFQTIHPPWLGDMYLWVKNSLPRFQTGKRKVAPFPQEVSRKGNEQEAALEAYQIETLARKVRRYWKSLLLFLPDVEWPWIIPASIKTIQVIKRQNVSCIVSSGPPHSSHLVGLVVKAITGVRWVADFRDPWTDTIDQKPPDTRCALSDYLQRWLECQVIRSADAIMTTTKQLKEVFTSRYPEPDGGRRIYLPNGFERSPSAQLPQKKYGLFTMTYTGTLYSGRNPEPVFKAVAKLISEGVLGKQEIRIKLVGECGFIDGVDIHTIVRSYGLEEVVEVTGRVSHAEALQYTERSHLLLLIAPPNHYYCVPAKAYEYLSSGTNILALTQKGATRDLIEETNAGACFSDGDIDGISKYILQMLATGDTTRATLSGDKVRQYDMQALAGRLDQVLSGLIGHSVVETR